jgi:molecular chaperone HtpG
MAVTDDAPEADESLSFQADVARLLQLMVHSVYSDRDIFLRELVANAADACEKLRTLGLQDPALIAGDAEFKVTLEADAAQGVLSVSDNGIGMSREDLVDALGTIARSGTKAFVDALGDGADPTRLIGQFGVGFYSAFMVADRVEVLTRRAGAAEAWRWTSDGGGSYHIAPLADAEAPARGTRVVLHLKDDSKAYAEPSTVERIVRQHASAVAVPIDLVSPAGETRRISDGAAIWAKPRSEVKPQDYTSFYQTLSDQFDEPGLTVHYRAEGRNEYSVLAFVPGSRPLALFDPMRKGRMKLYVRRMFISDEVELVPGYLRFVSGVVDSADLPLNLSREMIQTSPILAAIRKGVTNRLLADLGKLAKSEPETYAKVWDHFGPVLKEGLYEDAERRDELYGLARFSTSTHPDGRRSLADYVADLRPNQTAIWYLVGDDIARLKASPHLEGFRARGIEVLLLPDPVDAFWVQTAIGYEGKPFKSVTQGAADIGAVPLAEGAEAPAEVDTPAAVATFIAFAKQTLEDKVSDVRASTRLAESPACLVAGELGPDRRLEQILALHGRAGDLSKPVLELNPRHPLVEALAARLTQGGDKALVEDAAWLLLDQARAAEGEGPADPAAFAGRLTRVMGKALA